MAWLQHQGLAQAEAVWRSALRGFPQPTPFVRGVSGEVPRSQEGYTGQQLVFCEAETQALNQMTRQYQVTLNTLLLGAWSVIVSHYSQQEDIVFGMVVSGRPPTLAGVEYMVGSFNNFLPMRVQVAPDVAILPWLQTIKARQVEYSQYEYSPPLSIQQWSEVPDDQPLYESYLVFETFPVDRGVQHGIEHLHMSYLDALAQTEHPLRVVAVPGTNLIITLSYYRRSFDDAAIAKLVAGLRKVLMQIVDDPNRSLAALLHSVEAA